MDQNYRAAEGARDACQTMDEKHHSRLFTLRMWQAKLADGRLEWRGRLQHVLSGEVRYFRDLPMLLERLETILNEKEDQQE